MNARSGKRTTFEHISATLTTNPLTKDKSMKPNTAPNSLSVFVAIIRQYVRRALSPTSNFWFKRVFMNCFSFQTHCSDVELFNKKPFYRRNVNINWLTMMRSTSRKRPINGLKNECFGSRSSNEIITRFSLKLWFSRHSLFANIKTGYWFAK